jgi:glycolate oxidase iron-sulfur subunit
MRCTGCPLLGQMSEASPWWTGGEAIVIYAHVGEPFGVGRGRGPFSDMDLKKQDNPENDCILCGRCMEVCPVLQSTGREELGPRAKGLMVRRLKESGNGLSLHKVRELAGLCVGCDRCRSICPRSVDVPAQIMAIKSQSPEWWDWLVKTLFSTAPLSWPLLMLFAPGGPHLVSTQTLSPWLRVAPPQRDPLLGRVLLFPGCAARYGANGWSARAVTLLDSMGIEVEVPDFACCGFPLRRSGLFHESDKAREENVRLWREAGRPLVVTLCATCWSGLRQYYEFGGWESEEREQWLRSVTALGSLLDGARAEVVGPVPAGGVIIHQPCHGQTGRSWLAQAASKVTTLDLRSECCGFGGTLQLTGRDLSRMVAGSLWRALAPEERAQVLTDCSGCVMQLKMTRPPEVEVGHWLEIVSPE